MIKKYKYLDDIFYSEDSVRKLIWYSQHKVFPPEPESDKVNFWAEYNVEYSEENDPELTEEQIQEQNLIKAKIQRANKVKNIIIEVDGMKFQGDEVSQSRMSRVITGAIINNIDMSTTWAWVLADNTIAQPTITQLAKALKLAGEAQTSVWTSPYDLTKSIDTNDPISENLAKIGI